MRILNKYHTGAFKAARPEVKEGGDSMKVILHFGVGSFHRAHQAWALQNALNNKLTSQDNWAITGVCIMPQDIGFIEQFRRQDCLYFVQTSSPEGKKNTQLVASIKQILHAKEDHQSIITHIVSSDTKIITLTITEGGYNVDFAGNTFLWDNAAIQKDLKREGQPKTIFRFLADGLRKRKEENGAKIVLLSCDNIQKNGDVLKFALLEFLKKYDPNLIPWVVENVAFIKSMVDRITPAATADQKDIFAELNEVQDNCLVICEDYFQWVVQYHPQLTGIPLEEMGATIVEDVEPYEKMKLRLLNGGHSLVGLLGYCLGYDRIHTAVKDKHIDILYDRYARNEVIATLDPIEGIDYEVYLKNLKSRFSNPVINDPVDRIISGSTDKIPKFILPVMENQLSGDSGQIKIGTLVLCAWFYYLNAEFNKNKMQDVVDLQKEQLLSIFQNEEQAQTRFIDWFSLLCVLAKNGNFRSLYEAYMEVINSSSIKSLVEQIVNEN
ncbi:MAG TPA: mannitol dehydrogenase family protein [Arachidicoccus sp.]|nr:mannitol dehydrogenase family protein [Arachidicoccus sp.]